MHKKRKNKILLIIALIIVIFGMTFGFAVFSTTLNISSNATVIPNSDDFKITVYGLSDASVYLNPPIPYVWDSSYTSKTHGLCRVYSVATDTTCETAIIDNLNYTISNIKATFSSISVTQQANYIFDVRNEGRYPVYVFVPRNGNKYQGVTYGNCVGEIGTNPDLVESACNKIKLFISVLDKNTYDVKLGDIYGDYMEIIPGESELLSIVVNYNSETTLVDGTFSIEFPDVPLVFSTSPESK